MEWNNSCNNFTQQVCGFRIVVVVFALKKRDRYLTPGNSAKTWPFLGWWVKTWPFNSKVINVTSNGWGLKGSRLDSPVVRGETSWNKSFWEHSWSNSKEWSLQGSFLVATCRGLCTSRHTGRKRPWKPKHENMKLEKGQKVINSWGQNASFFGGVTWVERSRHFSEWTDWH